jgi:hypothetical protein
MLTADVMHTMLTTTQAPHINMITTVCMVGDTVFCFVHCPALPAFCSAGGLHGIVKQEGVKGLYRGLTPTLMALLPNWAVSTGNSRREWLSAAAAAGSGGSSNTAACSPALC